MSTYDLSSATTQFSFKLFTELLSNTRDKNVFISPASVYLALAMALNGAAGATRSEIARLLGIGDIDLDDFNRACATLAQALTLDDKAGQLAIANSLWANRDFTFDSIFLQRNRSFFNATIETLDFANPSAPTQINAWVNEQTRGRIATIVDHVPASAILYLINAIYFKGNWSSKFDTQATQRQPFHLTDGSEKYVPMMRQNGEFPYCEERDFQAIVLPYVDRRFALVVVLPRRNQSLGDFLSTFDAHRWHTVIEACRPREGTIALPRFTLEYKAQLEKTLPALGMPSAFEQGRADFSAMCNIPDVGIDNVTHMTFLEINEEGSEAAAATSVRLVVLGGDEEEPFHMVVDRPFFCAILDS